LAATCGGRFGAVSPSPFFTLKIVFLSPAAQGGGAEEVLFDLVSGLSVAQPAWSLRVICGESGPLVGRLKDVKVEVEIVPFPPAFLTYGEQASAGGKENRSFRAWKSMVAGVRFLGYCRKLKRHLQEWEPDVIHSNGNKMHLVSAVARTRGAAVVWHLHDYPGARRLTSRLLPRLASRVRLGLANSRSVADDARLVLPGTRIEILQNSVDLDRFRPEGERLDLDRLSGWGAAAPGTLKVGLIATFARWKGQDLFLRAIALLPKEIAVRFYLIGGPVYATPGSQWTREELIEAAAPLADRVGFTGWVDDAAAAIRALDIVVHASIQPEPFGLVIIQAMACGKGVVVSGEGGAAEVAEGEPSAVTFTPRDPQSLAEAMLLLIADGKRRAAAAVDGPLAARDRFGRTRMIAEAVKHLRSVAPDAP
jgi:glycosyltransferase involved in cell wall biosynthesis